MLLDTEAFTRSFYTEKSLHRRPCYTQKLLHTEAFTHSFYTQKLLHTSCKIAILHKFLPLDLHFARKGCIPSCETAILPHCMPLDLHFARKGCIPSCEIAILPHCMPLDLHFVRKVASQAARKTKNEDGKRQKRRFTYRFWPLCRGPRSTVPATKNESNSTTVSQNAILDRVIKIHQILRLPRKMRSESASHFDPRQRFSNLPKVAGLPRFCT